RRSRRFLWSRGRVWTYSLAGAFAALVLIVFASTPLLLRSRQAANTDLSPAPAAAVPPFVVTSQQGQQGQQALQSPFGGVLRTEQSPVETPSGPMIVRSVHFGLTTKEFDNARSRIEAITQQAQGYVAELNVQGQAGSARTLTATLRIPVNQFEAALTELR